LVSPAPWLLLTLGQRGSIAMWAPQLNVTGDFVAVTSSNFGHAHDPNSDYLFKTMIIDASRDSIVRAIAREYYGNHEKPMFLGTDTNKK
jgi:hypothetical protein